MILNHAAIDTAVPQGCSKLRHGIIGGFYGPHRSEGNTALGEMEMDITKHHGAQKLNAAVLYLVKTYDRCRTRAVLDAIEVLRESFERIKDGK